MSGSLTTLLAELFAEVASLKAQLASSQNTLPTLVNNSITPANNSTDPANNSTNPVNNLTNPANNSTDPANNSTDPVNDLTTTTGPMTLDLPTSDDHSPALSLPATSTTLTKLVVPSDVASSTGLQKPAITTEAATMSNAGSAPINPARDEPPASTTSPALASWSDLEDEEEDDGEEEVEDDEKASSLFSILGSERESYSVEVEDGDEDQDEDVPMATPPVITTESYKRKRVESVAAIHPVVSTKSPVVPPICPIVSTNRPAIQTKAPTVPTQHPATPVKCPANQHQSKEVGKINREVLVLYKGKQRCERCQEKGIEVCPVYEGVVTVLQMWANAILQGGRTLDRPAYTACIECTKKSTCCSHPITWDILGRYFSKPRFMEDGRNVDCLPYITSERDQASNHGGGQLEKLTTKSAFQDVEPPTKRVKKSHEQPVVSSSRARAIQPGPVIDQDTLHQAQALAGYSGLTSEFIQQQKDLLLQFNDHSDSHASLSKDFLAGQNLLITGVNSLVTGQTEVINLLKQIVKQNEERGPPLSHKARGKRRAVISSDELVD